ncbi:hypothetical protein [Streptomyces sp. NPDC056527]|uniref:hypothetical protein n=1 Tax=Streptomyces sp. NPDC056527 TaxID=3345853 RepID=UPI0036BBC098
MTAPVSEVLAFIDFVNLSSGPEHPLPEHFPVVGTLLDAVVLDFMPWGELRLAAARSTEQ